MRARRLAARIVVSALLAAGTLLATGPGLFRLIAPAIAAASDALTPLAVLRVGVAGTLPEARLEAEAVVTAPIDIGASAQLPPATRLGPVSISLVHALVPPAILLTGLLAWPCATRREALRRLALAIPAFLLVVLITVPPHLAGLLAAYVDAHRLAAGEPHTTLLLIESMIFLEAGGRWLVPLVVAAACIVAVRRTPRSRRPERAPAPLDTALVEAARAARSRHAG
jgi:hypothetical protein